VLLLISLSASDSVGAAKTGIKAIDRQIEGKFSGKRNGNFLCLSTNLVVCSLTATALVGFMKRKRDNIIDLLPTVSGTKTTASD
jgi:hypothetical protein